MTLADDTQDGRAADAEGPTLARARVNVGLSLSLENDPRGRTLGVGEEPAGLVYRWPPVSTPLERDLSVAYTAHTARRVFRGPLRLLILAARLHGPDTVSLLRELYQEGGVQDLLARVIAYPPRLDPHPDYAVSTEVPSEAEPIGPADPRPTELAQANQERDRGLGQPTLGGPPARPKGQERTPDRLTGSSVFIGPRAGEGINPGLPSVLLPDSTRDTNRRRVESVRGPESLPPSSPDSSPPEQPWARRSRPPDCPCPRHEETWQPRSDGTMRCTTCHP